MKKYKMKERKDINGIKDLSPTELVSMAKDFRKSGKPMATELVISLLIKTYPEVLFNSQEKKPTIKPDGGENL